MVDVLCSLVIEFDWKINNRLLECVNEEIDKIFVKVVWMEGIY